MREDPEVERMRAWGPGCDPRTLAFALLGYLCDLDQGKRGPLSQPSCEVQIVDSLQQMRKWWLQKFIQGQAQVSCHTKLPTHSCPEFTNMLL